MAKLQILVTLLLVASLCVVVTATALSPASAPAQLGPWCPKSPFPCLVVKPLQVLAESGIDARIWVRYFDEGLVEIGGYQLPSKEYVLSLKQVIRVTTAHPVCVDFHIKRGSKRLLVTATITETLAKKIAKPSGEESECGEPLYCIELKLVVGSSSKGKCYEVYSGKTLIAEKKY